MDLLLAAASRNRLQTEAENSWQHDVLIFDQLQRGLGSRLNSDWPDKYSTPPANFADRKLGAWSCGFSWALPLARATHHPWVRATCRSQCILTSVCLAFASASGFHLRTRGRFGLDVGLGCYTLARRFAGIFGLGCSVGHVFAFWLCLA